MLLMILLLCVALGHFVLFQCVILYLLPIVDLLKILLYHHENNVATLKSYILRLSAHLKSDCHFVACLEYDLNNKCLPI